MLDRTFANLPTYLSSILLRCSFLDTFYFFLKQSCIYHSNSLVPCDDNREELVDATLKISGQCFNAYIVSEQKKNQ